ncbi:RNA-binding protein [Pseudenhygromyxa sp. WMMC2535]|uniref:RNA recognition motif domain-containing protein n=1 Tax=Pseudenhygromyxa sp. WMMC2535 TaxID=2712867 RepID=UPI0015529253|nr:RNA-binding protein [Pseudenhygromyxa sp. WMMC2535]NVB37915.1 RNA-binding protein [Pseudenhygromyxa sp. WMMC2535]
MTTLYVGGLGPEADEGAIRALCVEHGAVAEVRVALDEEGRCRGFAYVDFGDDLGAVRARGALDGREIGEWTLRVALAT